MIRLTKKDNGATVEETITGLCHRSKPQVFCRSSNLLVVDCGNTGRNPVEYVKINGEFGLLTAKRNASHGDFWNWWYNRDPSRNGEFCTWDSQSETDTNKIFLYWDDLKNLPEVEYAQLSDTAIHATGLESATIKLECEAVGVGLRMWNCQGNTVVLKGDTVGRGLTVQKSRLNEFPHVDLADIGSMGFALTRNSAENEVGTYRFQNSGLNESRGGSLFFSGAHHNKVALVHGTFATYGRFWPVDGCGITFGEQSSHNVVSMAYVADSFNAAQDNSGHPGNRIHHLTAYNCETVFDQTTKSAQSDFKEGYGLHDPIEKVLGNALLINSGAFGVRTPEVPNCRIIGEKKAARGRWDYPFYPDLAGYEKFDYRRDAVNPQEIPDRVP